MPRPKRTKVASGPASSRRIENITTNTSGSNANPTTSSDIQDPISKLRARRMNAQSKESDLSSPKMSGAPKPVTQARTRSGRISDQAQDESRKVDIMETVESQVERVPASSLAVPSTTTRTRGNGGNSKTDIEATLSHELAPRAPQYSARPVTPSEIDDSTMEDLYGLSPGGETSQARIQARFASRRQSMQAQQSLLGATTRGRTRATPAVDESMAALTNFKRRARQPSLLRMVTRPSDIGLEIEPDDESIDDLDDLDLEPDDASTPLPSKNRHAVAEVHNPRDEIAATQANTSSSRKRKRGSDVQVPVSSTPLSSPPPGLTHSRSPIGSDDVELPEEVIHSTTRAQPQVYSDTMAPPMSSSLLGDDLHLVEMASTNAPRNHLKRGGNEAIKRSKGQNRPLSTVTLESLLPKSRRARKPTATRKNDNLDLSSSDEDSSSETPQPKTPVRSRSKKSKQTAKAPANTKRTPTNARRAVVSPVSARRSAGKAATRQSKRRTTYGRVRGDDDDKENESEESDGDDGGSETETPARRNRRAKSRPLEEVQHSEELEAARQKFAQVDEWEMEFESVESGPTSSDWR